MFTCLTFHTLIIPGSRDSCSVFLPKVPFLWVMEDFPLNPLDGLWIAGGLRSGPVKPFEAGTVIKGETNKQ